MLTLTHFKLCPYSRSVRLALAELGMEPALAEELPWAWRPAFLALNPSGDLPVLQLGDGLIVSGAYAISEYLGDIVRDGGAMPEDRILDIFPGNHEDRTEVRRLVDWFHRKFNAEVSAEMLREKVHARLRAQTAAMPPNAELLRAVRANLRHHMGYMSYLADQRRWLAGDDLSFADLAAAAHVSCLDYLDEVPWDAYPAVYDWYVRVKSRPSFQTLLTDRVAGLAPPMHYADLDF